jgi:hypothetical protein
MRALMQERLTLAASTSPPTADFPDVVTTDKLGSLTMLLFGCRSQPDDYLYENEWIQCVDDVNGNGKVVLNCTQLETNEILLPYNFTKFSSQDADVGLDLDNTAAVVVSAFSRKGRNAGRRVTHSIQTHGKAIWSLLERVSESFAIFLTCIKLISTTIEVFVCLICFPCSIM